ncbi:MAG: hypothetical protein MNPFHGCM_03223 [Gemmatimonadaceae bacterium]|nr:hypothetical protein [Gemmatimonadaceae bacterium]
MACYILRWRWEGAFPDVSKAIVVVAPHTSNWDFFIGLFVDLALDLKAGFLGKHSIFVWPVKRFLLWFGGIPVRRTTSEHVVQQMVEEFARRDKLVLAIAPEGTRKKVAEWRTGFWHIARGAQIPIVLVGLDYSRRVVSIGPTIAPSGSLEADMRAIRAYYGNITARHPSQF